MAGVIPGVEAQAFLKNLIHPPVQVQPFSVHLTAKLVAKPRGEAAFDFSGKEFSDCPKGLLSPERAPDAAYGWWTLTPGVYLIEYNEALELPPGHIAILQPWSRTLHSGLIHPVQVLQGHYPTLHTLVSVVGVKLRLKQNARISELVVLKLR